MSDTKELILITALRLFAMNGYEAVSVSMIASEIGMVKSALYKHYKSKRDIFDSILKRMNEMDSKKACENNLPIGVLEEMPEEYQKTDINDIKTFTKDMFNYWTETEFSSLFRKMLTLEQYRNEEMTQLYNQYILNGPLNYVKDLFAELTGDKENSDLLALRFYAPLYMLFYLYDTENNKETVKQMLSNHIDNYIDEIKRRYGLE